MRAFAVEAMTAPDYPPALHRDLDEITRRSAAWAGTFGIASTVDRRLRLARANAAELAARACPDGPTAGVELLADLVTWLFAFDDRCDEDELGTDPGRLAPVLTPLLDVLDRLGASLAPAGRAVVPAPRTPPDAHHVEPAAGPAGDALHDLCRRLAEIGHPGERLRFATAMRQYLFALLWEAANRQQKRVPRLTEYIQMRRHTGAVLPSFALTDVAAQARPAGRLRIDPRMVRLDLLAADLVCWCNDLFSYGKERGRDGHNLAAVIAADTGCGEEDALAEAAARFNAGLETYQDLEAELLLEADDGLTRMVRVRQNWLRGTYDWSLHAGRYT